MSRIALARDELRTNAAQWQAFSTEGHCVVTAPPGSGKTKLLTTRLAEDFLTTIPAPYGAACITLTNASADELATRLKHLGVQQRSTLFVGTVHSFALRGIIKPFAAVAGRSDLRGRRIATKRQIRGAMETAISQVYPGGADTRNVASTVNYYRKLADPAALAQAHANIQAVYELFDAALAAIGAIDFDGMISAAVSLVLDNDPIRQVLQSRYRAFYVDEYQDLAPSLDRLVRAICLDGTDHSRLFAVGDPDQAIYGWTGTRADLLESLITLEGITPVRLTTNYRSGEDIIALSQRALQRVVEVVGVTPGGTVTAHECAEGFHEQVSTGLDFIRMAVEEGIPLHEILVACPTNDDCLKFEAAAVAAGIACSVSGGEYDVSMSTGLVEQIAGWCAGGHASGEQVLGDLLTRWRACLSDRWQRNKAPRFMEVLLRYRDQPQERALRLLETLLALGIGDALEQQGLTDEHNALASMEAALSAVGELAGSSIGELALRARTKDRVFITTNSSSKGLEAEWVIMVGLDEGKVPNFNSRNPEQLREERQKFYVCLTRARRRVVLLYSGFPEWKNGPGRAAGPSRYLRDLGLA
jgi:DNA helicase-2/ATP-dependent DNA helicase PcrA